MVGEVKLYGLLLTPESILLWHHIGLESTKTATDQLSGRHYADLGLPATMGQPRNFGLSVGLLCIHRRVGFLVGDSIETERKGPANARRKHLLRRGSNYKQHR